MLSLRRLSSEPVQPISPNLIGIERREQIMNSLKKLIAKMLGLLLGPDCTFILGKKAYALIRTDRHNQTIRDHPCTN